MKRTVKEQIEHHKALAEKYRIRRDAIVAKSVLLSEQYTKELDAAEILQLQADEAASAT